MVGLPPRSKIPNKPELNKWPWLGPQTGFTYVSSLAHSESAQISSGSRTSKGSIRGFSPSHPYNQPSSFNGRENSFLFLSNEIPDVQDFFSDAEYRSFTSISNPSTQWIFDQGLLPDGTTAVARTLKEFLLMTMDKEDHLLVSYKPNCPGTRDHSLDKGQLFVCVTLSTQQNIERVLEHVGNLRPNIFDSNIRPPPTPQPVAIAGTGTGFHDVSTSSQDGNVFNLVSKSNINGDIYRHIADSFNQDIYVLAWRNGRGGKLGSDCPPGKKKIEHVEELEFFENPGDRLSTFGNWPETVDHAKWAVGQTHGNDLFCATDLNRMGSQVGGSVQIKVKTGGLADASWDEGRWGGGICLRNLRVANAFREF